MTDTTSPTADERYRLPRTVVPERYALTLVPDLVGFGFDGTCDTTVDVVEATSRIVLNSMDLDVTKAWVTDSAGHHIEADAIIPDPDTERLTLELTAELLPGTAVLHTEFTGVLNDKLTGFYRSMFTDTDGVEQVIATTQFEATFARRAFPCWDEPDFKAVFSVTLVVDPEMAALSNASEISRDHQGDGAWAGRDIVRFADTMKMSTYLVAFIVGPLDVTEPVMTNGTPLRIAYPRGKGHLTDFALEVGAFCVQFFADYYGIDYPGDKIDLVAVPDFAFGAMENLGCITFREVLVLVDPATATQPELQNVTDVIADELAHMWFGDLVTMKWWNGIWLNEAFATFMEMLATDAFRPEWNRWTDFGLSRTAAFDVDALKTTRPIEFPVVSPDDAEGMFDILTYEKGAAVVRMLEQYLGEDAFRNGIRAYLSANAYGNTETTDLWDALEDTTGEPVRSIMDSWIFQGGFPVIDVELLHDEIDVTVPARVKFTQRRYGYAGDIGEDDPVVDEELAKETWVIPAIFSLKTPDGIVSFEKGLIDADGLEVPVLGQLEWVLGNTEGTGFYRVRYSGDLLSALTADAHVSLSPIERYGLVDDAWAAVLAGDLSAVAFLHLLEGFGAETDVSVWERVVGALGSLDRLVDGDARTALKARIRSLLSPAAQRLGPDPVADESDRDRELRGLLLGTLGDLGADDQARARARVLYEQSKSSPGTVDPPLVAASINVVAATGGSAEFDDFLARYEGADTPQEQLRFLSALADFDDTDLMARFLDLTLTDTVRTQNAPYVLRRCLSNRNHGPQAWTFVMDNWDAINERFPTNSIVRLLEGVRSLSQPDDADRVFAFFEEHEVPQGDKTLAQHLERLEVNVAFRREAGRLADHLT